MQDRCEKKQPVETYAGLEPADLAAVTALLSEAFCRHDPLELALGITPAEFRVMLDLELPLILPSGLSTGVWCQASGDLLGVMIGHAVSAPKIVSQNRISPKFKPIGQLVGSLYDQYLHHPDFAPESSLYLYMIGVAGGYMGLGLSKKLINHAVERARQQHFRCVFAVTTNIKSLKAFQTAGFCEISAIKYAEFDYSGEKVFAAIGADEQATLVAKRL